MSDLLQHLARKFDDELRVIETDLVRGTAADFAAYQNACGKHHGLLVAKMIVSELTERLEDED